MVIVESQFDKKTYTDFFKYNTVNGDRRFIFLLCGIILFLGAALYLFLTGNMMFSLVFLALAVCWPIIWSVQNHMLIKKHLALSGLDKRPIPVRFEISDKKVVTLNKATSSHTAYKWEKILKVRETKQYLFIYVNKTQAAVINKDHIVEGSAEQLSAWAKEKVKNYKYTR